MKFHWGNFFAAGKHFKFFDVYCGKHTFPPHKIFKTTQIAHQIRSFELCTESTILYNLSTPFDLIRSIFLD